MKRTKEQLALLPSTTPGKKCVSCKEMRPWSEFTKNSYNWDGHQRSCIKCDAINKKRNYLKAKTENHDRLKAKNLRNVQVSILRKWLHSVSLPNDNPYMQALYESLLPTLQEKGILPPPPTPDPLAQTPREIELQQLTWVALSWKEVVKEVKRKYREASF
jgi:hypothetical protein